jgi:uncharacterized protein YlxW (UPF0749 family)
MSFTRLRPRQRLRTLLRKVNEMVIEIDGVEFILSLIATTTAIILAMINIYIKIKQLFLNAVKSIIQQEVESLKTEVKLLNEKYEKLDREIRELKKLINDSK